MLLMDHGGLVRLNVPHRGCCAVYCAELLIYGRLLWEFSDISAYEVLLG